MVNPIKRKDAFIRLGEALMNALPANLSNDAPAHGAGRPDLDLAISRSFDNNPWFTRNNIVQALTAIAVSLSEQNISTWLSGYDPDLLKTERQRTIAVVMAGNIPVVGFHDLLCVLMSGHKITAKLSHDDRFLLPAIVKMLENIEPGFEGQSTFTTDQLHGFDAVIATGSNNSARYFEYYFEKYPHIIRKNRNGMAILSGQETIEQLTALGEDVFSYFGLGCRNVSRIFLPEGYSIATLLDNWEIYADIANHSRYMNNYTYNRSVFLLNATPHFDNGFVLLRPSDSFAAPISVVNLSYYKPDIDWQAFADENNQLIQCIVSNNSRLPMQVGFGKCQNPRLWDYPDGVDTLRFLLSLT
jgi:hypothetical protein